MVYQYLTFEEMNQLMKHQIMSSSSNELSSCNLSHVPIDSNRPPSLSENHLLVQCMQKLGQYPACNSKVVLQESNGQIVSSRSSAKGEGGDDQHPAGGGGCTPRPRWCPTPEQIQVLETLFNSGTTTPSRDMIVEIAACLKQFGSIVEANVFYWFQNRKARAKRKLRMQAQLQQQQSASAPPADVTDHSQSAPPQIPTSRRVCAKTPTKTSPSALAAADHRLPPLMHLPASVNHADQHAAAACSLMMHDHQKSDQHAAATCSMMVPPPLYSAGDCNTSLQMINNVSGCNIMCSPNAEQLPVCVSAASCNTIPKKQSFGHEDTLHHGISQGNMPSLIVSHALAPLPSEHENADQSYNIIQNNIECDQYIDEMRSCNSARVSSRPGSAGGNNVMIGGCGMLQHLAPHEPGAAVHSTATINSHLYHAAAADFNKTSSGNGNELSAASNYKGDPYMNNPVDYTSTSTSTTSYPDQLESLRLSLPNKRSWMEALMQHFVLSHDSTYSASDTATTNIIHNMYNDVDHYAVRAHTNELLNNPIHSNFLQQQPANLLNPNPDAPRHASIYTTPIPPLSSDAMERTHSKMGTIQEATDGIDTKQHVQGSPPSHAAYQELHDAATTKRDRAYYMESLMSCNSATVSTSQQQLAALATSPQMFHHCDHLPLWEALAPYMSIGS